jgi:hypothetical protein
VDRRQLLAAGLCSGQPRGTHSLQVERTNNPELSDPIAGNFWPATCTAMLADQVRHMREAAYGTYADTFIDLRPVAGGAA